MRSPKSGDYYAIAFAMAHNDSSGVSGCLKDKLEALSKIYPSSRMA
ncbi:MAG: hypothetical protein IKZ88_10080 [Neisseriaceae bacterium]|nr:hypothetical protein [Neisseriaceae bacterium]